MKSNSTTNSPRKTRKPRVRRPKQFNQKDDWFDRGYFQVIDGLCPLVKVCNVTSLESKEARKLAAWLVHAADYLEQKQKGPK